MPRSLVVLLLILVSSLARAAEEEDDDEETELPPGYADETATLELLLDAEVGVATKKARPIRESPGVVTLVTREDIAASGARDLEDVLLLVPGFDFGVDVGGIVGIGFRGNWGTKGKCSSSSTASRSTRASTPRSSSGTTFRSIASSASRSSGDRARRSTADTPSLRW